MSLYSVIGAFVTCLVFLAFPPVPGYTPPWTIRATAWITLISLWPIVVMLAVCLAIGAFYRWHSGEEMAPLKPTHQLHLGCRRKMQDSPR
jgi:hypothetical protein